MEPTRDQSPGDGGGSRRIRVFIGFLVIVAAVVVLIARANRDTMVYYVTVSELLDPARSARASGLRVAEIPEARKPPLDEKFRDVWDEIPEITAEQWLFEDQPEDPEKGRYDEPIKRFEVDTPDPEDQSVTWQAAWV